MLKNVMNSYFNKLTNVWIEQRNIEPQVPFNPQMPNIIYNGEKDSFGYITWKPVLQDKIYNFSDIEKNLNIKLHPLIKSYLNSYYFMELSGEYQNLYLNFIPITPITKIDFFIKNHISEIKNNIYLEIGYLQDSGNDEINILINNHNGAVYSYDIDNSSLVLLNNNLEDLISKIEPRC